MTTQPELRQARYERACWWLKRGIEIVPLKPQSKELQPGYGACKAHITDVDFARRWFLNTNANVGVVLGKPSGLAVADWDNTRCYESWRSTTGASVETLVERTARGYHVFFVGEGFKRAAGNGCEFKPGGVCMVAPSVHPSGVIYRICHDVPIARIDGERARTLFPFLSGEPHAREHNDSTGIFTRGVPGTGDGNAPAVGGVVARIKMAWSILDEMSKAGIKLWRGGETTLIGLCPFHDDHTPSLWVSPQSGLWGCNRPDCLAAGTHDVINFRAMWCRIPNDVAIRQLAREVLGPPVR